MIAQLDANNICIGVGTDDSLVGIEVNSFDVLGKRYENGEWVDVPQPQPEPSQLDRIESALDINADSQAEILLNQVDAETTNGIIMDTLAEILLNQMGA